jgi:competence protein ComEC
MKMLFLALLAAASMTAVAQDTKPSPAAKPAPAAKQAPAPKVAPVGAILANKDSKIYHRADCKAAAKIKDANRTSFGSSAEAEKAGYKACKTCKP